MKMKIVSPIQPIEVLGNCQVKDLDLLDREVYLDGKRVPPGLETIILAGLGVLGTSYVNTILEEMNAKKNG